MTGMASDRLRPPVSVPPSPSPQAEILHEPAENLMPLTPNRPLILTACLAATFMAAIEATIIAIVMPAIARDLGDVSLYAWVFAAYMAGQAATIPIWGRLADRNGRRKTFFAGIALFLIGSTLCGFATSMPQLVAFRLLQGLGAGGVQPLANTIIADIYPPAMRARLQGLMSSVFGIAAIIGPSAGAMLTRHGAWPWVFWMNLPIGLLAIAMLARVLPPDPAPTATGIDVKGSCLLLAAVTSLLIVLRSASAWTVAALALTTFALIVQQTRAKPPILPFELWRDRVLVASGMGSLITGLLMMGVMAWLPALILDVLHQPEGLAALFLAIMAVVWVLGSTAAGLLLPRLGYRAVAAAGAVFLTAGAAALVSVVASSPEWRSVMGFALIGIGMGFCNTTFMVAAQTSVGYGQRGAATASIMFLRFLGQALGAAAFAAMGDLTGALASNPDQIAAALRAGYELTLAWAVLTVIVAISFPARLAPALRAT